MFQVTFLQQKLASAEQEVSQAFQILDQQKVLLMQHRDAAITQCQSHSMHMHPNEYAQRVEEIQIHFNNEMKQCETQKQIYLQNLQLARYNVSQQIAFIMTQESTLNDTKTDTCSNISFNTINNDCNVTTFETDTETVTITEKEGETETKTNNEDGESCLNEIVNVTDKAKKDCQRFSDLKKESMQDEINRCLMTKKNELSKLGKTMTFAMKQHITRDIKSKWGIKVAANCGYRKNDRNSKKIIYNPNYNANNDPYRINQNKDVIKDFGSFRRKSNGNKKNNRMRNNNIINSNNNGNNYSKNESDCSANICELKEKEKEEVSELTVIEMNENAANNDNDNESECDLFD